MQRFFNSAFCLTLVMTSALADGNRYTPNAYSTNSWRPVNPPAAGQASATPTPNTPTTRYRPQNPDQTGQSANNQFVPGGKPAAANPAYGDAVQPPAYGYGYGYGAPGGSGQPPYAYPQASYPDDWGYQPYPGYNPPAPTYGHPYQGDPAAAYNPYGQPPEYGYQPGYDQGYYAPNSPAPDYGAGYYPDYQYGGYDNGYGVTPQVPGYPTPPPGYGIPQEETGTPYPPYGYEQPSTYPAPQEQPQQNPSSAWGPRPFAEGMPGNPAANQVPPPAIPAESYQVDGAPAIFRPWTDPDGESTQEPSAR